MEIRHRILELNNSPKFEQLKFELDKIGATYSLPLLGQIGGKENYSIEFYMSENDPRFPYIQDLITKYKFYVQTGVRYIEQDIASAEWLYTNAGEYQYPQPEDGFGVQQATYEMSNYCMRCGIGAVQNNPFRRNMDFKQRTNQFLSRLIEMIREIILMVHFCPHSD